MYNAFAPGSPWQHFGPGAGLKGHRGHLRAAMAAHRGGFAGGGPWGMFGPGPQSFGPPWGGPGPRGWRGAKARRGDVRSAILSVLSDASLNGYQIIQQIADRSAGAWKPSPGSVYPTLSQLEDEGLVAADAAEGRRSFSLTEDGRSYVTEHADELAATWQAFSESEDTDAAGIRPLIGQVAAALWQLMAVGTPDQQTRAKDAVTELRRRLYAILAEEPDQR